MRCVQIHRSAHGVHLSLQPLLTRPSLPHCAALVPVTDPLIVFVRGPFWPLCSVPLTHLAISRQHPVLQVAQEGLTSAGQCVGLVLAVRRRVGHAGSSASIQTLAPKCHPAGTLVGVPLTPSIHVGSRPVPERGVPRCLSGSPPAPLIGLAVLLTDVQFVVQLQSRGCWEPAESRTVCGERRPGARDLVVTTY